MDVFKILTKYRCDENPVLLQHDGKELSTLSKTELIRVADSINFKLIDVAKVANIENNKTNLVKLLNAALNVMKDSDSTDEPAPKRKKSSDSTTVKSLEEKVIELEKKFAERKVQDDADDYERAKRDVKEEAIKGDKVDIDLLHEKLIVLERLSRKVNKDSQEKISLILSRFHIHKNKPNFAATLVLKLICNKEEESILDKEQKLLKTFTPRAQDCNMIGFGLNNDYLNANSSYGNMNAPPSFGYMGYMQSNPQFPLPMHSMPMQIQPRNFVPRRPRFRSSVPVCFKCSKVGHIMKDCTEK